MHSLIIGMSESGKTTLAKIFARELKKRGKKVVVLDPLNDPDWGKVDFRTEDCDEFLDYCKNNQNLYVFIDEGSESIGRYDVEMQWFATQSRHWGHSCFFITQGCTQIAPIIRGQCRVVYCFAVGESDTKLMAEEFRKKELKFLETIPQGVFYKVSRFSELQRGVVDFKKRVVNMDRESKKVDKASGKSKDSNPSPADADSAS